MVFFAGERSQTSSNTMYNHERKYILSDVRKHKQICKCYLDFDVIGPLMLDVSLISSENQTTVFP